ncbi:MAG: DGQHR domain-containing protein [Gomphosphaeria aponina SAG 52.96 = DSM 107014]|uniref:DGQHR domain-containing protein n=1 Tax=Gomphosphaeria aponina SAG 52.96 = DSM 107014 TaxID=1521640 RepID=A0A941JV05_9CHRO|nr:DGQHR domain-containing protein [Gomphosphaeria aponina SAG 52.96 = DSM 107014]
MNEEFSESLASKIWQREKEETEAIALLLSRQIARNDKILVQKMHMGSTEAFIGSVTLEWLATRVSFATSLPLFQQKLDPNSKNVVPDADTVEALQQRPLDWSRQGALTQYLAVRKSHKFPALLVVIDADWVNNAFAQEWGKGRATQSAAKFSPLDQDGTFGLLDVSEKHCIFALDGQHRLMGIQGLMELIATGRLQKYKKDKKPTGHYITIEDLMEEYDVNPGKLLSLGHEKIGIELIPSVLPGESYEEAKRRVRSIFVHVNLMAVPLSKGQLALLNEDNGFSIIARKVAVTHPLFKEMPGRNPRVNWNSATVSAKSTVLTTLQALQEISEKYLYYKFPHWKPTDKGLIPMRPEDEEIEEGLAQFYQLFDYLGNLPSYQRLENGTDTARMRRFSHEKPPGEGNILFRPVGQVALAQALGILVFRKRFSWQEIFEKMYQYDEEGGFSSMEFPESLWYGVIYDPNKKRVLVSGKDLAAKLIIYLLGGMEDKIERIYLQKDLATARTIENKAMGLDGNYVEPKRIRLPDVL